MTEPFRTFSEGHEIEMRSKAEAGMTEFKSMYHQSTTMVLPTGSTLNMLSGTPSFPLAMAKSLGG